MHFPQQLAYATRLNRAGSIQGRIVDACNPRTLCLTLLFGRLFTLAVLIKANLRVNDYRAPVAKCTTTGSLLPEKNGYVKASPDTRFLFLEPR